MISDEYLEHRLEEWADWVVRIDTNCMGYPRKTLEARLRDEGGVLISGTGFYCPPGNERAEEIERFVGDLYQQNKLLAIALRVYYLDEKSTLGHKAKKAGVSLAQYKIYLNMAKMWLAGRLSGSQEFK